MKSTLQYIKLINILIKYDNFEIPTIPIVLFGLTERVTVYSSYTYVDGWAPTFHWSHCPDK